MSFHKRNRVELAAARQRLAAVGSRLVDTRLGPIEVLDYGSGPPVLCVHGVVGGADQGPYFASAFLEGGFRILAVSRFGYLQSPLPPDPSPAAQADRYAALLDALGVEQAAVMGTSAGGPSSLQFALRHPARCFALVLWSMAVPPYRIPSRPVATVMRLYFGSDLAFWLTMTCAPARMLALMGVPAEVRHRLTEQERAWLAGAMWSLLPVHPRVDGIMNDICVSNPDLNRDYPLEQIAVPTLIFHAHDDPMPPFAGAERMAARIPGARLVPLSGGHLLLGHHARVRAEASAFLRQAAS